MLYTRAGPGLLGLLVQAPGFQAAAAAAGLMAFEDKTKIFAFSLHRCTSALTKGSFPARLGPFVMSPVTLGGGKADACPDPEHRSLLRVPHGGQQPRYPPIL